MKTLIYFFLLVILSSCFSYEQVLNNDSNPTFDRSKQYTLTLRNKTRITVKSLRIEGENYYYTYRNREKSVPISDVQKVVIKKFSWLKTGVLVVGILAVTVGIVAISLENMNIGIGEMSFK